MLIAGTPNLGLKANTTCLTFCNGRSEIKPGEGNWSRKKFKKGEKDKRRETGGVHYLGMKGFLCFTPGGGLNHQRLENLLYKNVATLKIARGE